MSLPKLTEGAWQAFARLSSEGRTEEGIVMLVRLTVIAELHELLTDIPLWEGIMSPEDMLKARISVLEAS